MLNSIKKYEVQLVLAFFVILFVVSVIIGFAILLNQGKDNTINVVETDSYNRSTALVNNSGVIQIEVCPSVGSSTDSKNKETPSFPKPKPDQNYSIPETGYYDKRLIPLALLISFPFVLIWLLFRAFAIKKI